MLQKWSFYATEYFDEMNMRTDEDEMKKLVSEAGCGLELISFSVAAKLDRLEETIREMQGVVHRLGDPPVILHGPFLDLNPMAFDSLVQEATFRRFSQAYDAAKELGAKKIVFHSGMIPTVYFLDGWAERMTAFWDRFLENRSGITVCMENVLDREFEPFAEVAENVQHPDFGLCLDIGHAHCYSGHGAFAWAAALAPYLRHLHVHDNDGSRDQHLRCGAGTVPIREILHFLSETDISGQRRAPLLDSLTVESFTAADAEESLRFVKETGEI